MTSKKPLVRDIVSALWSAHDKPERWVGLLEVEHLLPDATFYKTFVDVWVNSESNDLNLPIINALIDKRGVTAHSVMPRLGGDDRALMDRLQEDPTVYRGATVEDPYSDYSWTVDRDKAVWFAKRCSNATPALIVGKADISRVLFCYAGRGEAEVAIRTADVSQRKVTAIGPYRRDPTLEIFSLVQRGNMDALIDPLHTMQMRIVGAARIGKMSVEQVRQMAYDDLKKLEALGFVAVPARQRDLLDRLDWSQVSEAAEHV